MIKKICTFAPMNLKKRHKSKKGWYEETIIIICDSAHYFCTLQ